MANMSFRGADGDLKAFLASLNLGQYFANFHNFGYSTLQDCGGLNNGALQQIGVSPTGHRRRILKNLEAVLTKMPEKAALGERQGIYHTSRHLLNPSENEQTNAASDGLPSWEENPDHASQTLLETAGSTFSDLDSADLLCPDLLEHPSAAPGKARRNVMFEKISSTEDNYLQKGQPSSAEFQLDDAPKEMSLSSPSPPLVTQPSREGHLLLSGMESLLNDLQETPFFEFKGEMVENDLYDPCILSSTKAGPRPTRSFMLRHRPVPEIPDSLSVANSARSLQERRNTNGLRIHCSESRISKKRDPAEGKPPLISPYGETFVITCSEDTELYSKVPSDMSEENEEEKSPPSKTCLLKSDQCAKTSEDMKDTQLAAQEHHSALRNRFVGEPEYSLVKECSRYAWRGKYKPPKSLGELRSSSADLGDKEQPFSTQPVGTDELAGSSKDSIMPYACFYGPATTKKVKEGWLDKLSPQGKHMFQKRWVKFDGESMSYYNNDKDVYSKGVILLFAIAAVRTHGDSKFEVVTAHRIFVFRAEREDERNDWVTTISSALRLQPEASRVRPAVPPEKSGYLELKGYKAKIFTLLQGNSVWICKNDQDFKTGYGITIIPMNVANVRHVVRTTKQSFEIITPYRSFSFTTESEKEKKEWIEVLQQSIAETLSDYEVAEKIWYNESNRTCADCRTPDPDWASINLGVIICKKCAGHHRSLGPRDSKVRSLKMDASIWTNELVELFVLIGNKRANSFWEGHLQPDEELHLDSPTDDRLAFIIQKYKEGKFRKTTLLNKTKDELNKALCAAVITTDVLETMMLLFSGADAMCATGDPVYSTPYLLAKKSGQRLQMEFLYHNRFSDFSNWDAHSDGSCPDTSSPACLYDYLYMVSLNSPRLLTEKKLKEECNKRWCVLESGFLSYYENEKMATPNGMLDMSDVICLAIHKSDCSLPIGAIFTFEIYLLSERAFLFGAETAFTQRKWTQTIAKHFVPELARSLQERDCDVIGQLFYKDCHNLDNWKKGWFAIEKTSLHFCLELENSQENLMHLRRLQELTISSSIQNGERTDVLLLVEKGRTLYIHGHTKLDFTVWHTAVEKAAGTDGNMLEDQQLSQMDVPIIVNSCIAFVTQYGLGSKHIYLKSGDPSSVRDLLECFKKDARSVKLRAGVHQLEDVTDTLKCFLSEIEDALLTKELYPFWISALDALDEKDRVRKYAAFIRTLPAINRATLAALMEHLYRVQKCSEINLMDPHNLAMAFSSCLFQTKGQTSEEVDVIEDLIINYVQLFDVQQEQVKQMDIENSFITKWKDTQVSQAGDLLTEVYVERKDPDCSIIIRISPTMEAEELTNDVLGIKNITPHKDDTWATFEVIENGELERPLHCAENILEQILHWSFLANPSSACLIIKKFPTIGCRCEEKPSEGVVKAGYLKCKEEPSKLLSGNKFQDRYLVLREGNLLLYKDMKSSKPEKVLPVKLLKLYLGVKKKVKPPTNWGLTLLSEKHHWHLCCDGLSSQLEWLNSIFMVQHIHICPPSGKTRKLSVTKSPRTGGMPLIPIQHDGSLPKVKANLSEISESNLAEEKKGIKERGSRVVERKEEKTRNHSKKHRSLICLEDRGEDPADLPLRPYKESKSPTKSENRPSQAHVDSEKQLPANVLQELSIVLQRNKSLHEET